MATGFGVDSKMFFDKDGKSVFHRLQDHDELLDNHESRISQNESDISDQSGILDAFLESMTNYGNSLSLMEKVFGINVMDPRFKAVGDGVTDDTQALFDAHTYANDNFLPVYYPAKSFYKGTATIIKIKTSTFFGQAKIIINEAVSATDKPHFRIETYYDYGGDTSESLNLANFDLPTLLGKINSQATVISEFASYPNSFFIIEDNTTKTEIRSGQNASSGKTAVEIFVIEDGGRVVGEISKKGLTDITAIKRKTMEENWLIVDGGTFYLNGESNPILDIDSYPYSGFSTQRCRVIFRNQWVGIKPDRTDDQIEANNGFYHAGSVADIIYENNRIVPRIYTKVGSNPQGTYGMAFSKAMNITLRNCRGEGDDTRWGLYAPNNIKNLRIENCELNRVDTHFYCWNVDILNSRIGLKGISFTGGGKFTMKNTSVHNNQIIDFREDYGAFWDGDIDIDGVTLYPTDSASDINLLQWDQTDQNYNVKTPIARSIRMNNVTVNYRYITTPFTRQAVILDMPTFGVKTDGYRTEFPVMIDVNNIRVLGTNARKLQLMSVPKPADLKIYSGATGGIDSNGIITTNCKIRFRDVDCHDFGAVDSQEGSRNNMTFLINVADTITYSADSVIPDVLIESCGKIFTSFKAALANVVIRNCVINCFDNLETTGRTKIIFDNCLFQPNVTSNKRVYYVYGKQSFFNSCTFDSPKLNGVVDGTIDYGIISWDSFVRGNMSNCRCTESYYALKSPASDFTAMIANGTIQRNSEGDYRTYYKTMGTTAQRPTTPPTNFQYYDTTLSKPVWYTGTGTVWKDSAGVTA